MFAPLAALFIAAGAPALADEFSGTISRICDGDTLVVNNQHVRLGGN